MSAVASTSKPCAAAAPTTTARAFPRQSLSTAAFPRPAARPSSLRVVPTAPAGFTYQRGRFSVCVHATAYSLVSPDSYLVLGVARCFEKGDNGRLQEISVIEPLGASSLECMANGARTSFKHALGVTFQGALTRDKATMPEEFQEARFCDKFETRCEAAARTWLRPHAQDNLMDIVPLNKVVSKFNFSLDDKRVLNMDNVVTDDDNIKQDISIDVYGRQKKDEIAAALAEEQAANAKEQEEEDLEKLLAM